LTSAVIIKTSYFIVTFVICAIHTLLKLCRGGDIQILFFHYLPNTKTDWMAKKTNPWVLQQTGHVNSSLLPNV